MRMRSGPHDDDDVLGALAAGGTPHEPAQDPHAGPAQDPHAGHAHGTDLSVRPAVPEDASLITALQLEAWQVRGLVTEQQLAAVDVEAVSDQWHSAITAPPTRRHRVLTACAGVRVVGFLAVAPATTAQDGADDAAGNPRAEAAAGGAGAEAAAAGAGPSPVPLLEPPEQPAEIIALELDSDHTREGHGSRLLAACVDLAREEGATSLMTWAAQDDEPRTRFLSTAGFGPAGVERTLRTDAGDVVEVCWSAGL